MRTAFFCQEHGSDYILDDTTSGSFVCTKCGYVFTSCTPQESFSCRTISTSGITTAATIDGPISFNRRTNSRGGDMILITCTSLENLCTHLFSEHVDVVSIAHATKQFYNCTIECALPKIRKTLVALIILCHVLECHGHVVSLRSLIEYVNLHICKHITLEIPSARMCSKILQHLSKQDTMRLVHESNAIERYTTNLLHKLELIAPDCCTCLACRKFLLEYYYSLKNQTDGKMPFTWLIFYCVYKQAREKRTHAHLCTENETVLKTLAYWTNVCQPYYLIAKIGIMNRNFQAKQPSIS